MFDMSSISSHTGARPSTPLVYYLVEDVLLQTRPRSSRTVKNRISINKFI